MSNQKKDAAKVYAQISIWCKQWVRENKPQLYAEMRAAAEQKYDYHPQGRGNEWENG